jgi:hypothetical protein
MSHSTGQLFTHHASPLVYNTHALFTHCCICDNLFTSADLKNGFVWLREGGMNKRKVSEDPDSKTWWSVAPTPLVAGKTATLLYNSKAGPLAWIEDKRPKGKTVTSSKCCCCCCCCCCCEWMLASLSERCCLIACLTEPILSIVSRYFILYVM